jgi:hypothetical protein
MSRRKGVTLGVLLAVVVAVVVIVLWPAPDPLRSARTVYVDTGDVQPGQGAAELEEGLTFVLNDRNLTLVASRSQADVEIRIGSISVNFGDVTVSLGQDGLSGRVRAACEVIDLRSVRTYAMDLTVTLRGGTVTATLAGRKFWEFWK